MAEKKEGTLDKPNVSGGLKAIAEWYFVLHSDQLEKLSIEEIIVCDDGEIFYSTVKGQNYADNYCKLKGIGSKKFTQK